MTVAQLKAEMDRRFDAVDVRFADLEKRMQAGVEDTKRHMTMLYESMKDDMRLFADGIHANSERLDRHELRLRRLDSPRRR